MTSQRRIALLIIAAAAFVLWLDRRPRAPGVTADPVISAKYRNGAYIMLALGISMLVHG